MSDKTISTITDEEREILMNTLESYDNDTLRELMQLKREAELKEIERKRLNEERKSHFESFYQVNKLNNNALIELGKQKPKALAIFLFLVEHMNNVNAVVCSSKVLEEKFDVSRRTITDCIAFLRDNNFLIVKKSGTTNVYIMNDNLVWNSWGTNKKYCEFPANVMLTLSEQQNDYKDIKETVVTRKKTRKKIKG